MERKVAKYDELVASLKHYNNNLNVQLKVFTVGYIGSVDEASFHRNIKSLGVPDKELPYITKATLTATLGAFNKMARERGSAINSYHPPAVKRRKAWTGDHGQLPQQRRPPRSQ